MFASQDLAQVRHYRHSSETRLKPKRLSQVFHPGLVQQYHTSNGDSSASAAFSRHFHP